MDARIKGGLVEVTTADGFGRDRGIAHGSQCVLVVDGPTDTRPSLFQYFCDIQAHVDVGWSRESYLAHSRSWESRGSLYVETVFGHGIHEGSTRINE